LKTGSKSFKSSGIERMDFPQGFTYLGDSSFEECPGLKVVYLPSSVTDVGNDAFKNCNQSATVYAKTNEVQTKAKGKG
ncbi:leucine-rich repeat protein, partial [Treponema pedis]